MAKPKAERDPHPAVRGAPHPPSFERKTDLDLVSRRAGTTVTKLSKWQVGFKSQDTDGRNDEVARYVAFLESPVCSFTRITPCPLPAFIYPHQVYEI